MPNARFAHVDPEGRIILPPEVAARLGLLPGENIPIELDERGLRLAKPANHLARIYAEPTNTCNLDCRTCMRSVWEEQPGWMSEAVFGRLLEGAAQFTPTPLIFFGGFGEPLAHPQITRMVRQAKALGGTVALITNACLLDEHAAAGLLEAGLDALWVSIDGAQPESYADVRLGAELPRVIANLERFMALTAPGALVQLGIAFVAMRRNLHDLPEVLRLGERLGASRFSISNVLAHTPELLEEILYEQAVDAGERQNAARTPQVDLPRLDLDAETLPALLPLLGGSYAISIGGSRLALSVNRCPFVEKNSLSVRWDGAVSPCLPLLHTHTAYLGRRVRRSVAYLSGSLAENSLAEIWHSPTYAELRERLQSFDFSPCAFCNTCELSEQNLEDCFGSTAPACGGCLWAQGIIRCP